MTICWGIISATKQLVVFMASRPRSKQAVLKSKAPKAEQKSLSEPEEWMNALFAGGVTISKVRVSPRNAMR